MMMMIYDDDDDDDDDDDIEYSKKYDNSILHYYMSM